MPRKTARKKKGKGRSGRKAAAGGGEQRPVKDAQTPDGEDGPAGANNCTAEEVVQKLDGGRQEENVHAMTEREQIESSMEGIWDGVISLYEKVMADREDEATSDEVKEELKKMLKAGGAAVPMTEKSMKVLNRYDDVLFKEPPVQDDCDVCFLPLPVAMTQRTHKVCCGKIVCDGCIFAMKEATDMGKNGELCPFCRERTTKGNLVERVMKRVELDDPNGYMALADMHFKGIHGQRKDEEKALELVKRAADLGSLNAFHALAQAHDHGVWGCEKDVWISQLYYKYAAIKGCAEARHTLACKKRNGDTGRDQAKHFMMAARAGYEPSLKEVKKAFKSGLVKKEEYKVTMRAYFESVKETASEQRDKAAAWYATVHGQSKYAHSCD